MRLPETVNMYVLTNMHIHIKNIFIEIFFYIKSYLYRPWRRYNNNRR